MAKLTVDVSNVLEGFKNKYLEVYYKFQCSLNSELTYYHVSFCIGKPRSSVCKLKSQTTDFKGYILNLPIYPYSFCDIVEGIHLSASVIYV